MKEKDGMYDYELDTIMNKYPNYLGSFSHDEIPPLKNQLFSCIINYHNANEEGSHWVCLFHHPSHPYIQFFDSYGIVPSDTIQYKCRQYLNKKIQYSTHRIQNIKSSYCGLYCLYFLIMRYCGMNYYDIIYQFQNNGSIKNDKLLEMLFK